MSIMLTDESLEYKEGRTAYHKGLEWMDCPYSLRGDAVERMRSLDWGTGWHKADAESMK